VPRYEYRCLSCGETFNRAERMADHLKNRAKCPKCGRATVEQVFSAFFAKTSKKS